MNIHQIVQLSLSAVSAAFVVSMVIGKFITFVKCKVIEHKDLKEQQLAAKEKVLYLALKQKYEGKEEKK